MSMRILLLLATLSLTAASAWAAAPNIILIYSDDQGFGDASCLNPQAKFHTPHLDRLAREGLRFTDAHCSDTVCTPSRYGLLTGRYSWRTTLKRGVFGAERSCLIGDERTTLASMLRDRGYATGMVGKWHLGMDFPGTPGDRDWSQPVRDMPLDKGFDYFYGIPASMNFGVLAWFEGRFAAVPPVLYTAKKPNARAISDYRIAPPYDQSPAATKARLAKPGMETAEDFVDTACLTRFTDQALAWMKKTIHERPERPFFLYLPYTSPHKPVVPLPQFHGQGNAGAYGEFMIETDFHVGRILDFLDEQQLAEDTLVVFTSDNGPENTWKARAEQFSHHSNYIYRDGKRSVYEGGHRVPFFVRWPRGIRTPGRICASPICQTDLMATLADVTDSELSSNAAEDSESFYATFQNVTSPRRAPLVHHGASGRFAIRHEDWKLVMPHGKQSLELYDLKSDPGEKHDVRPHHAERVRSLTKQLTRIVCSGRSTPGIPQPNDTSYWKDLTWMTPEEYERAVQNADTSSREQ